MTSSFNPSTESTRHASTHLGSKLGNGAGVGAASAPQFTRTERTPTVQDAVGICRNTAEDASIGRIFDARQLRAFLNTDENVVLAQRQLPPWVARGLEDFAENHDVALKHEIRDKDTDLHERFAQLDMQEGALRSWLLADITRILDTFLRGSGITLPELRLDTLRGDGCTKFHADYVSARLLVTYVGPGTEWIRNDNVNRSALGQQAPTIAEANRRVVRDPRCIEQASTGDILVLKGETWPGNSGRGAVHRSPPKQEGRTRLILRIDDMPVGHLRA